MQSLSVFAVYDVVADEATDDVAAAVTDEVNN